MWFKPKAEPEKFKLESQDIWSALQFYRTIEQQRQQILELESRLNRDELLIRVGIGLMSVAIVLSAMLTAWNTYQLYQWQSPIHEVIPQ